MPAAFFGHDCVRRKMGAEPFYHEPFGRAVGLGHQVELTLQFESDAALEIGCQQRAGFARDIHCRFQIIHA